MVTPSVGGAQQHRYAYVFSVFKVFWHAPTDLRMRPSDTQKIRQSGLWNVEYVTNDYESAVLDVLETAARD